MSGIKIINVLKDDTFPETLELFRQANAGEVIFVLPKKSAVFRREDHFAAFASEAAGSGKSISILCSSADVNALARKYKFTVMSASKEKTPAKPKAVLTSTDDDISDFNDEVVQDDDDVVVPADQRPMVMTDADETGEDDIAPGMHIEDEFGPVDDDQDGKIDTPDADDMSTGEYISVGNKSIHAELAAARMSSVDGLRMTSPRKSVAVKGRAERPAPIPVETGGELDYIDAVWREKAAQAVGPQSSPIIFKRPIPKANWRFWRFFGIPKSVAVGILIASIFLLGSIVYAVSGSANVIIKPVSKSVDTQIEIQASDVFSSVDSGFGKIPGQLFEISKTGSFDGTATGQRDVASKARGKLTLYNEYSNSPQQLVATTRFESSTGLIFRTLQSVSIPGTSLKNGKVVPGSVSVDVIADKPGADYNLQPGKFIISAFKEKNDSERLAKIYGTSTVAFSGGANGPSKIVTQADYDSAKAGAIKAAKDQILQTFNLQSSGLMILDGVEPEISDVKSTANPDDAADTFTVSVTAKLNTVAFKQSDLHQLIKDTIARKERLEVFPDKLSIKFTGITYKPDLGSLSFTANATGVGFMPMDLPSMTADIKGKTSEDFRSYFKDKEGIESATVTFSPFWVRSVPGNQEKIKVQVDYGQSDQK